MKHKSIATNSITVESIQLCLSNSERLYSDALRVSDPTSASLLELSLEEVTKAWGLTMVMERKLLRRKPKAFDRLMKRGEIALSEEELDTIDRFLTNHEPEELLLPFDEGSFRNHKSKIEYLSTLLEYFEALLPVTRKALKRAALIKEIYGRYTQPPAEQELKWGDEIVDNILRNVDKENLSEIVKLKERGFYVDFEKGKFISPSARLYQLDQLRLLVVFLIGAVRTELNSILIVS